MRVIVQRVTEAKVEVNDKVAGKIDNGYLLLVGFTHTDTTNNILEMVKKIINLRIMDDLNGVMNKSILDTGGSILSVSQFTLYADTKKGNRPSYINALPGDKAALLYEEFNSELSKYIHVEKGVFGAEMKVSLINDGPITITLER